MRLSAFRARWPGALILLSSGYGEEEVLAQFAGTQLAGFLQKPYTPAQLAEKIKAAIGTAQVGGHPSQWHTAAYPEDSQRSRNVSSFAA